MLSVIEINLKKIEFKNLNILVSLLARFLGVKHSRRVIFPDNIMYKFSDRMVDDIFERFII